MSHHVFIQKLNYIHLNPVRVNFCEHELNYEFLSVKHYHEIEHPYNFLENYDRGFWQCFILVGDNTNKGEKARQDAQIKKPQCITLWL